MHLQHNHRQLHFCFKIDHISGILKKKDINCKKSCVLILINQNKFLQESADKKTKTNENDRTLHISNAILQKLHPKQQSK
jgi:hypothetical protein